MSPAAASEPYRRSSARRAPDAVPQSGAVSTHPLARFDSTSGLFVPKPSQCLATLRAWAPDLGAAVR
jgi:hypothetical protein